MASLFSAMWNAEKLNIKQLMNNLKSAVDSNKEGEALKYYADLKLKFESLSNSLSIASPFEKMKVKSFHKKIIGKAETLLAKKGWTENVSTTVNE